jgi:hypothetical protein
MRPKITVHFSSTLEGNLGRFCPILAKPARSLDLTQVSVESANYKERLEARVGIEPTHKGFADLSLTTWVPRLNR